MNRTTKYIILSLIAIVALVIVGMISYFIFKTGEPRPAPKPPQPVAQDQDEGSFGSGSRQSGGSSSQDAAPQRVPQYMEETIKIKDLASFRALVDKGFPDTANWDGFMSDVDGVVNDYLADGSTQQIIEMAKSQPNYNPTMVTSMLTTNRDAAQRTFDQLKNDYFVAYDRGIRTADRSAPDYQSRAEQLIGTIVKARASVVRYERALAMIQ